MSRRRSRLCVVDSIWRVALTVDVRSAGPQPIKVGSRRIVQSADVFEVDLQRHIFVLEREPTSALEPFEIGCTQPAINGHTVTFSDASD